MAATFMMKLVITRTKKAIPVTNMSQCASLNIVSQLMANHLAASVS